MTSSASAHPWEDPATIEPGLLLDAYARGIFPMAVAPGDIRWFSPEPRAILPLDRFHVPHGLRRVLKRHRFEVRIDAAFGAVMRGCAARDETWIDGTILSSYERLHRLGHAHSVEAWLGDRLAGGLYGVTLGGAFFGESMFHEVTDASNVALCALVDRLRQRSFTLLDIQWTTPHLARFGALEIPAREYRRLLRASVALERSFV